MTLWFVFALMTAAAIFAVLWPLGRAGRPRNDGSEATVYKDQLAEVDRDVAAELIGSSEAEAARVEVGDRKGGLVHVRWGATEGWVPAADVRVLGAP